MSKTPKHFTPVAPVPKPAHSRRGRYLMVDLGNHPELCAKFHDLKDATGLTSRQLLFQMVEFCILSNEEMREEVGKAMLSGRKPKL